MKWYVILTEVWPPVWLQGTGQGSLCLLWFLNWVKVEFEQQLIKSTGIWKKAADNGWITGNKRQTDRIFVRFLLFCLRVFLVISWDFYIKNPSERVATAMGIWNFQLWFSTPNMNIHHVCSVEPSSFLVMLRVYCTVLTLSGNKQPWEET